MARQLNITYFADRDMLGLVSDEDYEQFKDLLLEALHKEWPKAHVAVDDGEHASVDIELIDGDFPSTRDEQQAKSDVESRVHEIANDVIEEREWATEEEFENYDENLDEDFEERRRGEDDDDYWTAEGPACAGLVPPLGGPPLGRLGGAGKACLKRPDRHHRAGLLEPSWVLDQPSLDR